ncbi:phosphatase PAP2 family protein [Methylocapsa aurea]|uniref:phosphatase PAP2 family protein n=1 Tax=Methylocapsa aurea TaxID=663610 RepID=UPI000691F27A|nr:phosphatase PAP2 family protein [Methylocapsa aurea]
MTLAAFGRQSISACERADLLLVRWCARSARPRLFRASAIAISWMGNGWIYPALGSSCLVLGGPRALAVIWAGALNATILHCVYPPLKRWMSRPRPFQKAPDLKSLLAALDEHSFPSGHAMTLTGGLVPIVLVFPEALSICLVLWAAMAWARLAAAHHYPSDVLAGSGLGMLVSYPVSSLSLSFGALIVSLFGGA